MFWGAEEKSKMDLFFPRKCLLRIIFPGEGLLRFIFSWRRASEIFFLDFLRALPQIINGHPLTERCLISRSYGMLLQLDLNVKIIFPFDNKRITSLL